MKKLLMLGAVALLASGGLATAQSLDGNAPGATAGMPAPGAADGPVAGDAGAAGPGNAMPGMPSDGPTGAMGAGANAGAGAMGSGAASPPPAPRQYPVCRSRQQDECRNPGGR